MIKIKIITGSTRPGRFNNQPAQWIYGMAKARGDMEVELLDLEQINLPFLDESAPPLQQKYTKEHTKLWSAKIAEADGFIFVTPEYNHSVSAVLKNAVDYLAIEWNYKPLTFVSYGSLAGGSRAVEHWRGIAADLRMFDLREQIMLPNYWEELNDKGEYNFNERHAKGAQGMLDALIFWAEKMKQARAELIAK